MSHDFYGWLSGCVELLELQAMLLCCELKTWKHFALTGFMRTIQNISTRKIYTMFIFLNKSCPRHPFPCFSWHYSSWLSHFESSESSDLLQVKNHQSRPFPFFCRLKGLVQLALALVQVTSGTRCLYLNNLPFWFLWDK